MTSLKLGGFAALIGDSSPSKELLRELLHDCLLLRCLDKFISQCFGLFFQA